MIAQIRLIYLTNLYNLFINLCAIKANIENHKQEAIQTPMIKYIELSLLVLKIFLYSSFSPTKNFFKSS